MPEPDPRQPLHPDRTAAEVERRGCARFYFWDLPLIRYVVPPSPEEGRGMLQELSAEGMGLLLLSPLELGTDLLVRFPGRRRGATHTQKARVVHATPHAEGGWLVGCRLATPLRADELHLLLQRLSTLD